MDGCDVTQFFGRNIYACVKNLPPAYTVFRICNGIQVQSHYFVIMYCIKLQTDGVASLFLIICITNDVQYIIYTCESDDLHI